MVHAGCGGRVHQYGEEKVQEGHRAAGRPASVRGSIYRVLAVGCQALNWSWMCVILNEYS